MKITQEADYSIRIVVLLYEKNTVVDAKKIAAEVGVSLRFTLKILRRLVIAGILESQMGMYGGYKTIRLSNCVSAADIIEAVDGPIRINRCFDKDYICSKNGDADKRGKCRIHTELGRINDGLYDMLKSLTVDKLINL